MAGKKSMSRRGDLYAAASKRRSDEPRAVQAAARSELMDRRMARHRQGFEPPVPLSKPAQDLRHKKADRFLKKPML